MLSADGGMVLVERCIAGGRGPRQTPIVGVMSLGLGHGPHDVRGVGKRSVDIVKGGHVGGIVSQRGLGVLTGDVIPGRGVVWMEVGGGVAGILVQLRLVVVVVSVVVSVMVVEAIWGHFDGQI